MLSPGLVWISYSVNTKVSSQSSTSAIQEMQGPDFVLEALGPPPPLLWGGAFMPVAWRGTYPDDVMEAAIQSESCVVPTTRTSVHAFYQHFPTTSFVPGAAVLCREH